MDLMTEAGGPEARAHGDNDGCARASVGDGRADPAGLEWRKRRLRHPDDRAVVRSRRRRCSSRAAQPRRDLGATARSSTATVKDAGRDERPLATCQKYGKGFVQSQFRLSRVTQVHVGVADDGVARLHANRLKDHPLRPRLDGRPRRRLARSIQPHPRLQRLPGQHRL